MTWEKIENGKLIRHEKEMGFTIVAKPDEDDYMVEYWVLRIFGVDEKGEVSWVRDTFPNNQHFTTNRAEADTYLHGYVKYDGCSNWHFDMADGVMFHGCTKKDLKVLGEVLAFCWESTKELCPNWSGGDE